MISTFLVIIQAVDYLTFDIGSQNLKTALGKSQTTVSSCF